MIAHAKGNDGLSLCIQGTLAIAVKSFIIYRFIPVYTGNSGKIVSRNRQKSVYPCVYRELVDERENY